MKAGLVSIVLPIYNVEKYLDRCIESVINQTYRNLEILLVDDGSPDDCPQKCEEWAKKDGRIKVIHKANAGLGYARNTGIENASGEYICFFDSDDYIDPSTIEKAYNTAQKNNSDMVLFGHYDVNAQGKIVRTYIPTIDKESYVSSEVQEVLLPDLVSDNPATGKSTNLWLSACFCMYSMKLILESNWRFASERDIISEDVYSLLRLYRNVKKVTIIPEAFYYYCENSTSLTHTYKADRFDRIKRFYNACIDACDELNYIDEVKKRFSDPFISNTIAAMKMIIQADMSNDKKKLAFKAICKDEQLHRIINSVEVKKEKFTRRLLIWLLKARLYSVCELLVRLKA